jgi:hypothetical protein
MEDSAGPAWTCMMGVYFIEMAAFKAFWEKIIQSPLEVVKLYQFLIIGRDSICGLLQLHPPQVLYISRKVEE